MRRQHQQKLALSAHHVVLPTCNALVRVTCAVTAARHPAVPDSSGVNAARHPLDAINEVALQIGGFARDL